jgi:hypothetical protein
VPGWLTSLTAAPRKPSACTFASAGVMPTPVPVAPALPTDVTVTVSRLAPLSMARVSPTLIPATFATLIVVSPAAVADDNVVATPAVPIAATVGDSRLDPVAT